MSSLFFHFGCSLPCTRDYLVTNQNEYKNLESSFEINVVTSPTLPMAWESEEIMLIAPKSCNISSAAIVSAEKYCTSMLTNKFCSFFKMIYHGKKPLILDSAKAMSSLIVLSKWWQTISISWNSFPLFSWNVLQNEIALLLTKCSSRVLIVKGRVGLVEEGSTLGSIWGEGGRNKVNRL